MTRSCDKFIFELAKDFAPFGRIYSLKTYERLMVITNVIGAKHSSQIGKLSGVESIYETVFVLISKYLRAMIWQSTWSCTATIYLG